MPDVKGRSFLVTGASSGIGLATADALLGLGGKVTVAARSEAKTRPVIDALKAKHPGAEIEFLQLDLADLAATKRSAEAFLATGRPLDVLINNAGLAGATGLTKDGFDITVGTDFLGPYLFTKLLLPKLEAAPQGRIVNVASEAHYQAKGLDWASFTRSAPSQRASLKQYSYAKLMNVHHAKELARQLTGTKVTTYSLHPGVVASDAWRELPRPIAWFIKLFMISIEEGAKTSVYCATDPGLATTSGRYYDKSAEKRPSRHADDEALAKEVFAWADKAIAEKLGTL
jgi:dehydrogenase/reductase SDR family protein 13